MEQVWLSGPGVVDEVARGARIGASGPHVMLATAQGGAPGWRGNRIGLKEGVKIGGWGGANKGKHIFVENDVMRDDDAVGDEVKTAIPLVVRGVAKEEAASGARR
jgi:hypothetical protein